MGGVMDNLFMCYANHTEELERIIKEISEGAMIFQTELTLTNIDMEYIRREVERRLNGRN